MSEFHVHVKTDGQFYERKIVDKVLDLERFRRKCLIDTLNDVVESLRIIQKYNSFFKRMTMTKQEKIKLKMAQHTLDFIIDEENDDLRPME